VLNVEWSVECETKTEKSEKPKNLAKNRKTEKLKNNFGQKYLKYSN
jgi:hypothetical protein